MNDRPAIEASGLTKSYDGVPVLGGVDLSVPAGQVFALLGPNGAGKTTLVRILSTLLAADAGRATVAGFDVARQRHQVRAAISLTGQYAALDEAQTGAENLRMMGRLAGLSGRAARERSDALLAAFDLTDAAGRRVSGWSGGMRRRLDLAAGLVRRPAVMFLDEPTTGLDPRSRQELWRVVGELAAGGVTIFLTTQYLDEADQLADAVAVIDAGRLVATGTPAELKRRVADQRLDLTIADAARYAEIAGVLGSGAVGSDPERLRISLPTDGSAGHIRDLLDRVDPARTAVRAFTVHTATLDDVFLALTGAGAQVAGAPSGKEPAGV